MDWSPLNRNKNVVGWPTGWMHKEKGVGNRNIWWGQMTDEKLSDVNISYI